jgi:hypothetical protein
MSLITRDYKRFVTSTIHDTHVRYQPPSISKEMHIEIALTLQEKRLRFCEDIC